MLAIKQRVIRSAPFNKPLIRQPMPYLQASELNVTGLSVSQPGCFNDDETPKRQEDILNEYAGHRRS
jgi:hypothetical protein